MEFSGAVSLQVLIQKSLKTLVTLEEKLHTHGVQTQTYFSAIYQ